MPFSLPFGKLRAGCFGKVPAYAEYLSVAIGGGAEKAFRQWADAMAGALQGKAGPCPTGYRFVQRVEGDDRLGVGLLWDSVDRVGRRRPFGIYTACPRGAFPARALGTAVVAERLWRLLAETAWANGEAWVHARGTTEAQGDSMRRELEERLAKARFERPSADGAEEEGWAQLAEQRTETWLTSIFPGRDGAAHFALVLWRLASRFANAANFYTWPAVRLPWIGGGSCVLQMTFWLGILDQLGLAANVLPPSILVPEDASTPEAALIAAFRPLAGTDAPVLFGLAHAHADLIDLRAPAAAEELGANSFRVFTTHVKASLAECRDAAQLARIPYPDFFAAAASARPARADDDETRAMRPAR